MLKISRTSNRNIKLSFQLPRVSLSPYNLIIYWILIVEWWREIVLAQEKKQEQLRHGIHGFDAAQMKKVDTKEKNPLPTQEAIDQEKLH